MRCVITLLNRYIFYLENNQYFQLLIRGEGFENWSALYEYVNVHNCERSLTCTMVEMTEAEDEMWPNSSSNCLVSSVR